ncbi:MAG TPA: RES family NAD+ phosphorylase [Mucilaginibacter sp.]|nr:RES family NAD+ phosphorylase [Mucilaginibacter sp.]
MLLYRLTKCIYANDLTGTGARLYGGRWNSEGKPMVYLASSRSLAVLEALVHLPPRYVPDEYCMATMEAPDDFAVIDEKLLPKNWQDFPDMDILKQMGNAFLMERKNLLLKVPSAIVAEEFNYLLNPFHPQAQKVKLKNVQPFSFDNRLTSE